MTSEAHIQSAAEAVLDISAAMLTAAGECLTMHGPDPNSPAILSAALCLVVDKINSTIDADFKRRFTIQLLGLG